MDLYLHDNALTGTLPAKFTNTTNLKNLFLSNNQLQGPFPLEIRKWRQRLEQFYIDRNNFSGILPTELGLLTNLIAANMYQLPFLNGTIPSEIGNLSRLRAFTLWNSTNLTGTIPSEIGQVQSLELLMLATLSSLSGVIPSEFGLLTNLLTLQMFQGGVSGPLPSELGRLFRLQDLFLPDCHLSGMIPTAFGDMKSLSEFTDSISCFVLYLLSHFCCRIYYYACSDTLSLALNALTGAVPSELHQLSLLDSLFLYGNNLTGPFTCPEYVSMCAVSCNNKTIEQQCRVLD